MQQRFSKYSGRNYWVLVSMFTTHT